MEDKREADREAALKRLQDVVQAMKHSRKHKYNARNPFPNGPTTQYRIDKVATQSLTTRVDPDEVSEHSRRLAEQDKYTTSEYWKDSYQTDKQLTGKKYIN